jgi:hypothetical protein
MTNWVKCHHKSKDLTIHVNLELATHIIEQPWGSRICWPYEGEDGSYLDVKEKASDLLRGQSGIDATGLPRPRAFRSADS